MEIKLLTVIYPLCMVALINSVESKTEPKSGGGDKVTALAVQWAPKIFLASKETFFPSDVESFLKEVTPQCDKCPPTKGLPTGPDSAKYFLTTKGKPDDLLKKKNSFLYGVKPTKPVPAYAYVKACDPSSSHIVISYWFFYPFNEGKKMCGAAKTLPIIGKLVTCKGNSSVVGNHVGDWEHMALELKDGEPTSLFLSVHDGGVFYSYNKKANSFDMKSELKEGILKVPNPPKTIKVVGGHPVLYSALGSHAVWASAGTFQYSRVEMKELTDETSAGPAWETWRALKVFGSSLKTPSWWDFQGKWGNAGSECVMKACLISDGPKGLSERPKDFKC